VLCYCREHWREYWRIHNRQPHVRAKESARHADQIRRAQYGMSLKEYNRILESQGGVCLICKRTNRSGRRLAVDHCHVSKKNRGLLCDRCNRGIGFFGEDTERMKAAIAYLERDEIKTSSFE